MKTGSYIRVEPVGDSDSYYLLPFCKIAVPVGDTAQETLCRELAKRGEFHLPNELDSYPVVTHKQLDWHFSNYTIVPLVKEVLVTKPLGIFSGYERDIRERQLRVARENEIRANKMHKITSSEFFRGDEDLEEFL